MKIIMLGAQGSGKGTQAQLLSEKTGMLRISTGDLLREMAASHTQTGEKIRDIINSGALVPDDIMIEILKQRFEHQSADRGFVLDGFPRTLAQAKALDTITDIDAVIYIEISDAVAIKRLSGRIQCKQCKEVYGTANPPLEEGICDKCYGELYQRDDDKPEAIKKRLHKFHEEIKPLLEHYKKKTHVIDGERDIEEIKKDIDRIVEGL